MSRVGSDNGDEKYCLFRAHHYYVTGVVYHIFIVCYSSFVVSATLLTLSYSQFYSCGPSHLLRVNR